MLMMFASCRNASTTHYHRPRRPPAAEEMPMISSSMLSKRPSILLHRLLALCFVGCFVLSIAGVAATPEGNYQWLEKKSTEKGVVTLPSGLRFKVLKWGKGGFHPTPNSPCDFLYTAALRDGQQFESSLDKKKPSTFASHQVIPGWAEAMQMMVEGDKWELYVPSELAYGPRGKPPVPADTALMYTLELVQIKGDMVVAEDRDTPLSPVTILTMAGLAVVLVIFKLRKKQMSVSGGQFDWGGRMR